MRIYSKILTITLPLTLLSLLAGAGITYSISRGALTTLAEKWLETRLAAAIDLAKENEEVLRRFGLEEISANVIEAQADASAGMLSIEVGELGTVFVVDSQGLILAHPDEQLVGSDVSGEGWFRAMKGNPKGELTYSWQGVSQLALYEYFPPWEWYVVASDPQSEVYGAINRTVNYILALAFLGAGVMAVTLVFLVRRLTAPLRLLAAGAEQIGQGNLETRIPVHARDEFGDLAAVFNQMAAQLQGTLVELEKRAGELAVLMRLGYAISANLDLDTILETTYQCVGELMDNDAFWIVSYQPGAEQAQYLIKIDQGVHYPLDQSPVEAGISGYTIRTDQPVLMARPFNQGKFSTSRYGSSRPVESILSVPLLIGDQIIGAMSAQSYTANAYSEDELDLLTKLAQSVAIALENARLYEAERQQATDLAALVEMVSTANAALEFTQLQDAILRQVAQACDAYRAALYLIDEATGRLLPAMAAVAQGEHGLGDWETFQADAARTGLETIPAVQALLAGGTSMILDGPEALAVLPRVLVEPYGTTSLLAAPIISRGRPLGILTLDHIDPDRHFSPRQANLALAIANQLGIAIRNARLHEQVQRHAAELEDRVAERTQELVAANARLLELDQLKSKFISDVSHELRTPVANLSLYLDLLKLGKPERSAHYIDVLKQQTGRLMQLVSDVLDTSRLEKSKEEMAFTAVDLNLLIAQIINGERLRAEAAGLRLLFTPHPGLTAVWGNHNRLVQVVSNLVGNAINYTSAGQVEVRACPVAGQNQVLLTVSDTGRGIGPEDLPHLFDRFYRGQSVGQIDIPGTGLGLAIVREIVELHGGRVEVESAVGQGSLFQVWLPGAEDGPP